MDLNVYAPLEVRNLESPAATVDLYKICPTYEDALDVYREKFGEPETIREDVGPDGKSWWLDEDGTGAASIVRYALHMGRWKRPDKSPFDGLALPDRRWIHVAAGDV